MHDELAPAALLASQHAEAPGKPCRSPTPQLTEPLPSPYGRASPNAGIHSEMRRWATCSLCGPRRHSPQHPRLRVHIILHVALTDPDIITQPGRYLQSLLCVCLCDCLCLDSLAPRVTVLACSPRMQCLSSRPLGPSLTP